MIGKDTFQVFDLSKEEGATIKKMSAVKNAEI